jgi:protein-disulfide isomerase
MIDQRIGTLNTINNSDIVIGDTNAPVTIFIYSRFDCSACNDFFEKNYNRLKNEFIDNGAVKLVIRYLVHSSKEESLYATKCAYYAYENGLFDSYIDQMSAHYPDLDTVVIRNSLLDLTSTDNYLDNYLKDNTIEDQLLKSTINIRNAGIHATPTIFINNTKLVGNRRYAKIKEIIWSELENESCE